MKKKKTIKYTCTYSAYIACDCVGKSACMDNSYKLQGTEGAYTSSFFPKSYSLDNYIKLFTDTGILNFPRMFTNTLIVAVFSCIISTFLYYQ